MHQETVETDSAIYTEDFAVIKAGPEGAFLWRWELVPETDPVHLLKGEGVDSILRMSRKIKMFELVPTSKWLFRLDRIDAPGGDPDAGRHSHPGSGIRCLLGGELRVRSDKGENSDNVIPGDCWYEEGAYPVWGGDDIVKGGNILRGMVLPTLYETNPDTAIWIEAHVMPKHKCEWKKYVNRVITLR
jgi:hypothetical protein